MCHFASQGKPSKSRPLFTRLESAISSLARRRAAVRPEMAFPGEHIGMYAFVVTANAFAGTCDTRLDLIGHKQDVVFFTQIETLLYIPVIRDEYPGFS